MINILFISSHLFPQGPNRQLLYLCTNIDKNLFNPIVVTTSQNVFEGSLHDEFLSNGIKIIDLKLGKFSSFFLARNRIQNIVDLYSVYFVFSYGFRSDIFTCGLLNAVRITSVRNTLIVNWKYTWGPILGTLFGYINLYYIRKFDYVIACSRSISNYLYSLGVTNVCIRNSVGTHFRGEPISKSFHSSKESKSFITVSSKLKGKNIEFLVESFVRSELRLHRLYVAGYVKPKIISMYSKYNNIIFLGHISNLADYLAKSDYFISSSLHEGMPNAVLESLSFGTPVILSDIPSHLEILQNQCFVIGEIFINNSYNDLLKKINILIKLDYEEISSNCQLSMKANFSALKMANEYEKFMINIVS